MLNLINTRILISGATILAAAALIIGATFAFFSDTETSTGNTLQAGALDLKVDNTCYYNGQACINGFWDGDTEGESCSCTWELKDLEEGDIFFDFTDLKPGDWEEDTISLHVFNNDAWACVDLNVTDHVDNGCTEPEAEDGDIDCVPFVTPTPAGGDGDIAQELDFMFWREEDGDNVFEEGEELLTEGRADAVLGGVRWALADSQNPLLDEGPLQGSTTYYIGKAFCYGELTPQPLPTPGVYSPTTDNDGDQDVDSNDGGFSCDGSQVDNKSQTDRLSGDVIFYAEQARNNEDFLCNEPE